MACLRARGGTARSLKILVDMNLSPGWVEVFRAAGWEAVHWSQVGRADTPDAEVFAYARAQGAVVFTSDLDFPAILAAVRSRLPSVVQLRSGSLLPSRSGERVVRVLRQVSEALQQGAVVVIEAGRHRVRVLPLP